MRSYTVLLGLLSLGMNGDCVADNFLFDDDVRVLSEEIEIGYRRDQFFDRNHSGDSSIVRARASTKNRDRVYLSGRTNAFQAFPQLSECDNSRSGARDRNGTRISCKETWTTDLEYGAEWDQHTSTSKSVWLSANLYWPLRTRNQDGLFDPYGIDSLALGISLDGRRVKQSSSSSYETEIGPVIFLRQEKRDDVRDSGFLGDYVNEYAWSAELGAAPYWRIDDELERALYAAAELTVDYDYMSKVSFLDPAKSLRIKYKNVYDTNLDSGEYDRWSAEFNLSWRLSFEGFCRCDGLFFDVALGYLEDDGEGYRSSGSYIAPSLYWRYAPGEKGTEHNSNRNSVGGMLFSFF